MSLSERDKQKQMQLDFEDFLDYMRQYVDSYIKSDDNIRDLIDFLKLYYKSNIVEDFNKDEITQLINTLNNYTGKQVITDNCIKYLSLIIDFARSNNFKKKVTYWCTFSKKYTLVHKNFDDQTIEVNTIAKLAINCISKDYLESIDLYDETSYKYYLSDECCKLLDEAQYGVMHSIPGNIDEEILDFKEINS